MEWVHQVLSSPELRLAAIPSAFLLGVLSAAGSCCSPAVLGVVAGYSGSAESDNRGDALLTRLFFLMGTVAALAALGAVAGFVGQTMGSRLERFGRIFAGVVVIFFGLAAANQLPLRLPKLGLANRSVRAGPLGAAVFGLAVGGASAACMTCCSPLIVVPLGVAALRGEILIGAGILAAFALGYGLALLVAAIGLQTGLGRLKRISPRTRAVVNTVAGVLLLVVGFYLLATA